MICFSYLCQKNAFLKKKKLILEALPNFFFFFFSEILKHDELQHKLLLLESYISLKISKK